MMFGFFKKKDPPPPRPPSPFNNDGNPIHQAILGLKSGDSNQVRSLFKALGDNPVILPMAEAGNLATGAAMMFAGAPHLAVYTRREFITNENASEYSHVDEVLLSRVCWAISSKADLGLLINPGHPDVGVPLTPPIFKLFRDAVEQLRAPLHCVASYPTPGQDGTLWAPALAESDPLYQQMAKLATGDESQLKLVLSSLVDCFITLPLKEAGRLESALVLRVNEFSGIVAFTRPEFIDLAPVAKEYPYRAQMTVRQLCSHVVSKNAALVLNPRHPSSVPIIPRLFKQLLEVAATTPPPIVKPAPSLPPLPNDDNPIHRAILEAKKGDKTQLFRLFDALATTPIFLTLAEQGKLETCGAILVEGDTCLTIFTRLEYIRPEHLQTHPHIVQNLLHQVLALAKGNSVGVTINQGNSHVGMSIPPAAIKIFSDAVAAGLPTPVLGGLYYTRNENDTFSVLKILKADEQVVHIRQYSNQYPFPPTSIDESTLYMAGMDRKPEETLEAGHLPISKKSFAVWNAVFFQQSTVSEDELDGYKMWLKAVAPAESPTAPESTGAAKEMIKVFDAYGREHQFTREDWRIKVLPEQFKQHWNDPEQLGAVIEQALRDGFFDESLEPAKQLQRIDPNNSRGAIYQGVALLQLKRSQDAEDVLNAGLRKHGEDGVLLTNLAKAQSGLGRSDQAEATLWKALQLDPNMENAVLWYAVREKERGGESGEREALLRLAALPGSWRALLWLAQAELQKENNLPKAMHHYAETLHRMEIISADVLMQISGDLGKSGHIIELIELCAPRFDPKTHGLPVGNNLLKAYVDTGQAELARRTLQQLYSQQRPDWKQTLLYWDGEIDKLDKGYGAIEGSEKPEWHLLMLEGPIWARDGTPFSEMLPAKNTASVKVAFLCGSAELPAEKKTDNVTSQPTNSEGRFTRGLPMYLAEQLHLHTDATGMVFTPWMKQGGFVLSGVPWGLTEPFWAINGVQFLVSFHLVASQNPWLVRFTLTRQIDNASVASWEEEIDLQDSAKGIHRILTATIKQLQSETAVGILPETEWFFPPTDKWLPTYVVALEQALAVSCATLVEAGRPFLSSERSIIDNHLNLSLEEPNNIACRFLLLSSLETEKAREPSIAGEFKERIERLQREKPLVNPAQSLADAAVTRIFAIL
jgi:tetratricopeptide (TPR) repeat protein